MADDEDTTSMSTAGAQCSAEHLSPTSQATYTLTGDLARAATASAATGVVLHSQDGGPDVLVALSVVPTSKSRTVCVCVDASEHSMRAWQYACENFIRRTDRVILLTVVIADVSAWDLRHAAEKEATRNGQTLLDGAVNVASSVYQRQVNCKTLKTEMVCVEKQSAVGEAIRAFLDDVPHPTPVNTCVLGSRGMGAVNRQLCALMGLGSVSDYVLHNTKTVPSVFVVNPHLLSSPTTAPEPEQQ